MKHLKVAFIIFCFVFCALFVAIALDQPTPIPICRHINASETISMNSRVETGTFSTSFVLTWIDASSQMEMILRSPSGLLLNPSAESPIVYSKNKTMLYFIVPSPEPGNWSEIITAKNLSQKGEDYCIITVSTGANQNQTEPGKVANSSSTCKTCNKMS